MHIIKILIDKDTSQLQLRFALWTREAVKTLIRHEFGMEIPISTVGDYLAKWQFTSKKPIIWAYERKEAATKKWLEEEYPKIKEETKREDADIWWADETTCVSLPTNLGGYASIAPKIKPVLYHLAKKSKINMISAITNTGKSIFALYDDSIDIGHFIDFCEKVIQSNDDKKVYLIVDDLRVHHTKRSRHGKKSTRDRSSCSISHLTVLSPTLMNI